MLCPLQRLIICCTQVDDDEDSANLIDLKQEFLAFEKRHGTKKGIETVIADKRRGQYEEILSQDRYNFDVWFDYIRLEEAEGILAAC